MIVAQTLTEQDTDDPSQVGPLLDQIDDPIARVTADGAYDGVPTYQTIAAHGDGIVVVIPAALDGRGQWRTGPALTTRPPSGDDYGTGPTGLAGRYRLRPAFVGGDGLFANDKFCLTRQGSLVLSWRRSPPRADRLASTADTAVSGGCCPLGADHEATAVDGDAAPRQPFGGRATVGSGLPAAPCDAHRGGSGHPRCRCSDRQNGGGSSCT